MPIFSKKTALFAKVQTVADTFLEPIATDWVEATDISITPLETDQTELAIIKRSMGANQQLISGHRVKMSFSTALAGSGTAGTAPYWGVLERICGMAQTIVATTSVAYTPADSAHELGSIACYIGTNKHAMKDARGTSSIEWSKGGFLVRKYDITGIYIDPVTATVPAAAITPRIMPETLLPDNTTFTLHGASVCVQSCSIDTGFDVKFLQFLACTNAVTITDRSCKGSIEIVAEALSVKDWFAICKAGTTGAFAFNLAAAVGKKLAVNAPKVQLMNPQYGDQDGIKTLKMDMILQPSAGSDDYTIINT